MSFNIKSGLSIYEESERRHLLPVFTCEHLNDSIILIIMSETGTYPDFTIVTDNGDISNVHKDLDQSDISVSSKDMVDII